MAFFLPPRPENRSAVARYLRRLCEKSQTSEYQALCHEVSTALSIAPTALIFSVFWLSRADTNFLSALIFCLLFLSHFLFGFYLLISGHRALKLLKLYRPTNSLCDSEEHTPPA